MTHAATRLDPSAAVPFGQSGERSRSTGSLLVATGAVAFSTAGLFTRLVAADVWTVLFWRGVFGGLLIAGAIVWRERSAARAGFAAIGRAGVLAAGCSTVGTMCFVGALRETTVADVTVIYATAPFVAAGIAWAWTRERPRRATLLASGLALLGVGIMGGAALAPGHALGDLLALATTGLMASMMVVIRRHRQVSMLPAACLSAFACAAAVLPLASPAAVTAGELGWLVLFGTTQFGLGLLLLTMGSRLVPAGRASLLANLELPFAPLWVWLAFGEGPARSTWVGGGLVCLAVLADLAADCRSSRRPAR